MSTTYPSTRVMDPPDVIVSQRMMLAVPTRTWKYLAKKGKTLLVMDLDDDVWSIPQDNPAHGMIKAEYLANLEQNLRVSDLVTVTTPELAERVAEFNPAVEVLPNMVPEWLLTLNTPRAEGSLTIGWAGSQTHRGDFQAEREGLRSLLDYSNRTQLHTIGTDYTAEIHGEGVERGRPLRIPHRHHDFLPRTEDYYRMLDFHVALAPLARNQFNRSKSDIRWLEAAATGAVSVMSDWGPYSRTVGGILCETPDDWRDALSSLMVPSYRAYREGLSRTAAESRTIELNICDWFTAYERSR